MILEIVISVIIILAVFSVNKYIISPKRKIQSYRQQFQAKGYRVYTFPYKPLTYPIIQTIYRDSLKGDALLSYKTIFSNYDVLIGNQLHLPSISVLHPKLRTQFAVAQRDNCYQKQKSIIQKQARFIGYGLAFSQGDVWKRKRKIMGSLFTYNLVKDNISSIQTICQDTLNKIQKKSKIQDNKIAIQLVHIGNQIFSKTVISLFLGMKTLEEEIDGIFIGNFITELANDANMQGKGLLTLIFGAKYLDWGLTQNHRKVNKRLRAFNNWARNYLDKQIKQSFQNNHQQNSNTLTNKNILSVHLKQIINQEKDKTKSQKLALQKEQLINEVKNFVVAGTDTTSTFFRMMIYYITKNPTVQAKLRAEVQKCVGFKKSQPLTIEKLKQFTYIDAIQNQTTRMFGPINFNFPRRVLKDHYIDGIPIHKQTIIQYHTVCSHYNLQFYENPHQFKPERWIHIKDEQKNSARLVGFGLGPRSCIGQHLALIQSKIALIKFYQRYSSVQIKENSINFRWKFFYKPDNFKVYVQKRQMLFDGK